MGPFLGYSGRASGLGGSLGSSLDASGSSLVLFGSFLASCSITFSICLAMTFVLHGMCLSFSALYFLFYTSVCEETWSAELPGGSIFMLLGGKLGMGIADTL